MSKVLTMLAAHWRGVLVAMASALLTLAISLGFGVVTPQAEIRRLDARIDSLTLRTNRQLQAIVDQHGILTARQDSALRMLRGLVAVQCIDLDAREVALTQLPCREVVLRP